MIIRALTALAAPEGERAQLSVFYFHRVLAQPDPLLPDEPDARLFDRILGWIGAQFRVLDPLEACDRLYDGSLPSRPAIITFDDGYRDNFEVALPILQRHRMQAAFFVATGFLNGESMFNDRAIEAVRRSTHDLLQIPGTGRVVPTKSTDERRAAIDQILKEIKHLAPAERDARVLELEGRLGITQVRNLMMTPDQVARLHRAGMRLGGHTRTHPILLSLDDVDAQSEISGGLQDLHGITGERPVLFAYPNGKSGGDFDDRHVGMVERAGCRYGFTTQAGAADATSRRFLLPRATPWARNRLRFGLQAWKTLLTST